VVTTQSDTLVPEAAIAEIAEAVIAEVRRRKTRRAATYRLQLHHQFTLFDAAAILPFLRELGVSHVYCSPYLRARAGSMHGYDICDHNQINPELGGEEGYRAFTEALAANGLGQVLDIVANHVAASLENPLWLDVLENGRLSPYAHFFDIDWRPVKQELANKVLLPVLGQQYGEALEDGQLRLEFCDGAFVVRYYDHVMPIGVRSAIPLLSHRLEELRVSLGENHADLTELESIITACEHLPAESTPDGAAVRVLQREKEIIKRRLRELAAASPRIKEHLLKNVEEYNGDRERPESFDLLDRLLSAQAYRVCQWRAAADEINYRRFFDINDLAAICMESPDVFHRTHGLVRKELAAHAIDGLRIDHVDGLYDPEQYLWRLQWAYIADLAERLGRKDFAERLAAIVKSDGENAQAIDEGAAWRNAAALVVRQVSRKFGLRQPADDWTPPALALDQPQSDSPSELPLYVLVEKILGPDEPLPEQWPVAGTSGYDFMNSLNGLFVAPQGLAEIVKHYDRLRGEPTMVREVEYESKLLILRVAMSSELQMLAHRLNRISEQHRRSRDLTLNMLRLAVREVLACFPVYRIYPGHDGISDRDRRFVNLAVSRARRRNPAFDPSVFEFLRRVLLLEHPSGLSQEQIAVREIFTGKFQQVTSPVMAKGVEDTAFYVYVPLASVNEVGSHPARPATAVADFHQDNRERQRRWPLAMLASSTHDTKRSEDVRARLNVLSETPRTWREAVNRFRRANRRFRHEIDGELAPSRNDEYLFYQSVLGIWPSEPPSPSERAELVRRLQSYMEKATHEAKQLTSWINPNPAYDEAMRDFVSQALRDSRSNRFIPLLLALHARIAPAGHYNALFQVALKLLSPGVPDIYQGQGTWDLSLVDPDNRRPVDYQQHRRWLSEVRDWESLPDDQWRERVAALARSPSDPRLKLLVTHKLLVLRRELADVFLSGEYVPLSTFGALAQNLVTFGWREAGGGRLRAIAVVPRLVFNLLHDDPSNAPAVFKSDAWVGAHVMLPDASASTATCLFTRKTVQLAQAHLAVQELLETFPLSVLRVDE
jgi:(1->4)-alpha-D-glucan 1-alpha-D-glucosylmutase